MQIFKIKIYFLIIYKKLKTNPKEKMANKADKNCGWNKSHEIGIVIDRIHFFSELFLISLWNVIFDHRLFATVI
jgi:hypothetical protein